MDTSNTRFFSPFGNFELNRLPLRKKETLRAWDAADEYLLKHLAEDDSFPSAKERLLLVNDQFGALACHLSQFDCVSWSDSLLCHLASQHNLKQNQLPESLTCLPSTELPSGQFSTVLIKLPKTLALLEQQLIQLRPFCHTGTRIIAAGMVKHIQTSALALFERIIGPTTTSLAVKKARLVFAQLNNSLSETPCPYPRSFTEPTLDLILSNHANVFAKEKLDIGARFMLSHFNKLPQAKSIIDLGCGNGVLGIMAKRQLADSHISFVDESYMAIDSARRNFCRYFPAQQASFYASNCLQAVSGCQAE